MTQSDNFWDCPYKLSGKVHALILDCDLTVWDSPALPFTIPDYWTPRTLSMWRRAYTLLKQLKQRIDTNTLTQDDELLFKRINERRISCGLRERLLPRIVRE